jgi:hypothetical protein
MTAKKVEWILVVRHLLSHHKAIYGRLTGQVVKDDSFSKDYIQLPKTPNFRADIEALFGANKIKGATQLFYKWGPSGEAVGSLVFESSDRPHLSWETNRAPAPWRMAEMPTPSGIETIPGEPNHQELDLASAQFSLISSRGGGQPFLLAIKLRDEPDTLHLRAYLEGAEKKYAWASTDLLPVEVQGLLRKTSRRRAVAWLTVAGEQGPQLTFDPAKNHDAWLQPVAGRDEGEQPMASAAAAGGAPVLPDSAAEVLPTSEVEVEQFCGQIQDGNFEVDDEHSTVKTRGSAQRAFSDRVKKNYEGRCAVTGIATRGFLVAAHIVPWSEDKSIRLDPSNGICLSALVDKAFELGYVVVEDDLSIAVDWALVGDDDSLKAALKECDGQKLRAPLREPPKPEYLKRRRGLLKVH